MVVVRGESMRKTFVIFFILLVAALAVSAQSTSNSQGTAAKPTAIISTTAGKMTCTLFPDKAPIGVENFIGLASGTKDWKNPVSGATKHGVPLYDGTIFHRVIPGFMIQGGDPAGNGTGDPGYKFKNEVSPDLLFDQPGRLAYANSGPHPNGGYTIFGQCDEATVALVKTIAHMATDPATEKPFRPVKIVHISVVRSTGIAPKPGAGGALKKSATTPAPNAPTTPH